MIHEFYASGQIGMDGVMVPDGDLVATIDTKYPLSNVLACIRMQQLTARTTESTLPETVVDVPPPNPSPDATTTKEEVPTKGKSKKPKWAGPR